MFQILKFSIANALKFRHKDSIRIKCFMQRTPSSSLCCRMMPHSLRFEVLCTCVLGAPSLDSAKLWLFPVSREDRFITTVTPKVQSPRRGASNPPGTPFDGKFTFLTPSEPLANEDLPRSASLNLFAPSPVPSNLSGKSETVSDLDDDNETEVHFDPLHLGKLSYGHDVDGSEIAAVHSVSERVCEFHRRDPDVVAVRDPKSSMSFLLNGFTPSSSPMPSPRRNFRSPYLQNPQANSSNWPEPLNLALPVNANPQYSASSPSSVPQSVSGNFTSLAMDMASLSDASLSPPRNNLKITIAMEPPREAMPHALPPSKMSSLSLDIPRSGCPFAQSLLRTPGASGPSFPASRNSPSPSFDATLAPPPALPPVHPGSPQRFPRRAASDPVKSHSHVFSNEPKSEYGVDGQIGEPSPQNAQRVPVALSYGNASLPPELSTKNVMGVITQLTQSVGGEIGLDLMQCHDDMLESICSDDTQQVEHFAHYTTKRLWFTVPVSKQPVTTPENDDSLDAEDDASVSSSLQLPTKTSQQGDSDSLPSDHRSPLHPHRPGNGGDSEENARLVPQLVASTPEPSSVAVAKLLKPPTSCPAADPITMPSQLSPKPKGDPRASAAAVQGLRHPPLERHVLFVDDEPVIRKLVSFQLRNLGCTFALATDGDEVPQLLAQQRFDIILMDIVMQRVSGTEACKSIRRTGNTVPIIATTANSTQQDQGLYREAGFDGCLAKPYSAEELRWAMLNWTASRLGETAAASHLCVRANARVWDYNPNRLHINPPSEEG